MLQSATQLSMGQPKDDEEMIDYNNALRNGIFEAYAGMLQGFKKDKSKIALLMQHAEFVLSFVEEVTKDADRDEAVTRAMVGVMGDMADTMDGIGQLYSQKTFWKQRDVMRASMRALIRVSVRAYVDLNPKEP